MKRDAMRSLVRRYTAAWAASDRAAWLSTFALDATQEDPVGEGIRRGREEIGTFWDGAMSSFDSIEIRERHIHLLGAEAALEWTIVARDGDEWVVFDGVDIFSFNEVPLITAVRAFWDREDRVRTLDRP